MKRPKNERITLTIVFVIFVLYAISLIYPFVMMFYNSFKSSADFFKDIWSLPDNPTTVNYKAVFEYKFAKTGIFGMFLNSAILVTGGVGIGILLSCMTSYIIAKYPFKGSKFIYTMVVICMMIPTTGSLSATYNLMYKLKLLNKFSGNFLMQGGFGAVFLYLYAYFKSVSWTYAESAFIDGAGHTRVFFQIMLPQVIGGVVAFFLISFISAWNDYFSQYLFRARRSPHRGARKDFLQEQNQGQCDTGILLPRFGGLTNGFDEFSIKSDKTIKAVEDF